MARGFGTNSRGGGFSDGEIQAVWNKAQAIPGQDTSKIRKDRCGATISRSAYGQQTAQGWEVDHIKPVSKGGGDELGNLQPLQWENNRHKADDVPGNCKRTS